MEAEIISTGSELLLGLVENTTAGYLSRELHAAGIRVRYITVVGDEKDDIKSAVSTALARADLVITTGGLGPTPSDITKQAVAEVLNLPLQFDEKSAQIIKGFFAKRGRAMSENNLQQAWFAQGSVIFDNEVGTAPAAAIVLPDAKIVAHLPGPPHETEWTLENRLLPWLRSKLQMPGIVITKQLRTLGIGEAQLAVSLQDILDNSENPRVSLLAGRHGVTIRLTATAASSVAAQDLIDNIVTDINTRISEYIYSFDGEELQQIVSCLLNRHNLQLVVAESCTGGKLASRMVSVDGASRWFKGGIICYSNQVKKSLLSVSEKTLSEAGAVSQQAACQMAEGAYRHLTADLAVAITGIAGPGGGSESKPVGLVYIAIAGKGRETVCRELKLMGTRANIRNMAVLSALNLLRIELMKI